MTVALFQIPGILPLENDAVAILAMNDRASGPAFLRWRVEIPSGPRALLLFASRMASSTIFSVTQYSSLGIFRTSFLFILFPFALILLLRISHSASKATSSVQTVKSGEESLELLSIDLRVGPYSFSTYYQLVFVFFCSRHSAPLLSSSRSENHASWCPFASPEKMVVSFPPTPNTSSVHTSVFGGR